MPVFPDVASMTVWPGLSSPDFSAASMTPSASRSLTDPRGLNASILTKRFTPLGASLLMRTIGVRPIVSRMLANFAITLPPRGLDVQCASVCIQYGFLHHLGQGRMREHGMHQFFFSGLQVHRNDVALDQFCYLGADHVSAEQLPGIFLKNDLHEALVLAERNRFSVAHERKPAHANVDFLFLGRLLGQPYGSDLR